MESSIRDLVLDPNYSEGWLLEELPQIMGIPLNKNGIWIVFFPRDCPFLQNWGFGISCILAIGSWIEIQMFAFVSQEKRRRGSGLGLWELPCFWSGQETFCVGGLWKGMYHCFLVTWTHDEELVWTSKIWFFLNIPAFLFQKYMGSWRIGMISVHCKLNQNYVFLFPPPVECRSSVGMGHCGW